MQIFEIDDQLQLRVGEPGKRVAKRAVECLVRA